MWLGGARARGRMPVVELLFPLDPAEGDVCVTCTRTLVVNRCTFFTSTSILFNAEARIYHLQFLYM